MFTARNACESLKAIFFLNLILVILSLFSCKKSPHKPRNDLEKMRLFGKVKQVIERTFSKQYYFEDPEADPKLKLYVKDITKFNLDGNIEETRTIYYDVSDSLTQTLNQNKTIFLYDKNGFLITEYNTMDSLREKRFNYDDLGNLKKIQWFLNSTPLNEKYEYKYDRNDHLIEEMEWDTTEIPKIKKIHKYDNQGHKRETTVYKRNREGQLIFNSKSNYTYDSLGTIIETLLFYRNDPATKSSFTYDSYGNTILSVRYNSQGVITNRDSSFYEYDHYKNWIKKMDYSIRSSFYDPLLIGIEQRVIDYY